MHDFMPAFVKAEREALLVEIEAAFGGVIRGQGVSWSESLVTDNYGFDRERAAARAKDAEGSWRGLLNTDWSPSGAAGSRFWTRRAFATTFPPRWRCPFDKARMRESSST